VAALELIDDWPVEHRAAAVLVDGDIVDDRGEVGLALPWASVTKLATALSVLIAVDAGHLALETPAGPPGSTVRHLLAHASGLDFERPVVRTPPGTRRIYSNAGYETLADVVAARLGRSFATWLDESVLEPLALTATALIGSPASGLVGPIADLVGLAAELQRPTLVSAATAAEMARVAFGGLAGVLPGFGQQQPNDWGLGPEIRGIKDPHWTGRMSSPTTFGHFGAAGGFVWVDPVANVACCCLTASPFGPWAAEAWPVLSDRVLEGHRRAGASRTGVTGGS